MTIVLQTGDEIKLNNNQTYVVKDIGEDFYLLESENKIENITFAELAKLLKEQNE